MLQKGISGSPLLEMTTENLNIILGAEDVTLQMSAPATQALDFREGVYELKLINDVEIVDIVDTLLEGKVIVEGL
jgi:hypothetical protein